MLTKVAQLSRHNKTLDSLKGLLILFVIFGHVIIGDFRTNIIRFVIYSFHMPLFLFLSGYLINTHKLMSYSFIALTKKYWHRMLLYWLIAWVIYTIPYYDFNTNVLSFILYSFIDPVYHLWYVPSLFVMIIITYLSLKIFRQHMVRYSLVSLALILLFCSYKINFPHVVSLRLSCYFFFGLLLRNYPPRLRKSCMTRLFSLLGRWGFSMLGCVFLWYIILYLFIRENDYFKFWHFFNIPINILILIPMVKRIIVVDIIRSKFLSYIGLHSLSIYLYHAAPILLCKYYLAETNIIGYYCIMTITFVVFSLFVIKYCD